VKGGATSSSEFVGVPGEMRKVVRPSAPAPSSVMMSGCESTSGRNMLVTCAEAADEAQLSELFLDSSRTSNVLCMPTATRTASVRK
jgi:hypothetical protein